MEIEEIKIPEHVDCCAAYKVAGCIIELTSDGEYAVWSIGRKPELLLERIGSFVMAVAVACSVSEEKGR